MVFVAIRRAYRWVFARARFSRWNRFLLHLGLRGLGILNYENESVSGEKYLVNQLLPGWLGDAPTVFDVGAHVGKYSRLISDRFPGAVVHAFEPNPRSRAHFAAPEGVHLHPVGLGASPEMVTLYDRSEDEGSSHASLYSDVITDLHGAEMQPIDVTLSTLDDVCVELGVGSIDLLKIDVEGHELAVLSGAKQLLNDGAIGLIQFEFNEMNVVSRTFLRDFRALLPGHRLYRMLPKGLLAVEDVPITSELFAFQNILAVPGDSPIPG